MRAKVRAVCDFIFVCMFLLFIGIVGGVERGTISDDKFFPAVLLLIIITSATYLIREIT